MDAELRIVARHPQDSLYNTPKIAAMGSFIANAHIAGPWSVNFSDADAKTTPHAGKVYRYGERVNSAALKNLALLTMRSWKADGPVDPSLHMSGVSRAMLGPLMEIFWIPPEIRPGRATLPAAVWMPDIQMLVARESADSPYAGLFLSVRGGHNAESHNHNTELLLLRRAKGGPAQTRPTGHPEQPTEIAARVSAANPAGAGGGSIP